MMPWFIWNGKSSLTDFGLWISKLPKYVRPAERHDEIEIPGRAGSLTMLEGEDVYASYTDSMTVTARNGLNINKIVDWLSGSGELVLFNDIDKARPARIVDEVAFQRVGAGIQQAVVPFLFQPFKKERNPQVITITGASGSITNIGDVASKPIVKITGTGNNTITIGDQAVTFSDISGTIIVDCDANIITSSGAFWTGSSTGELWTIPKGTSAITQTGSMTIEIQPNWRWR